jgi:hypothetical protein
MSQYNKDWYKAAFELFKRGGKKYELDGVYLWNVVSWDVQGIHPASSEYWGSGSYKDPAIIEWIKVRSVLIGTLLLETWLFLAGHDMTCEASQSIKHAYLLCKVL